MLVRNTGGLLGISRQPIHQAVPGNFCMQVRERRQTYLYQHNTDDDASLRRAVTSQYTNDLLSNFRIWRAQAKVNSKFLSKIMEITIVYKVCILKSFIRNILPDILYILRNILLQFYSDRKYKMYKVLTF